MKRTKETHASYTVTVHEKSRTYSETFGTHREAARYALEACQLNDAARVECPEMKIDITRSGNEWNETAKA